jgi:UPF0716 protein FxsA
MAPLRSSCHFHLQACHRKESDYLSAMGLLIFIIVPAVELWLLINVGGEIGALRVLALIIFTGVVGWSLVKWQGLSTLRRIREELSSGQVPAREMVAGLCLVAAGLLLITPGFLTDIVGFLLLVPPLRRMLAGVLMKRFKHRIVKVSNHNTPTGGGTVIDI